MLAEAAANKVLLRYLTELVSRCSLIIALYESPGSVPCASAEHNELIDLIAGGEARKAAERMDRHLLAIERKLKLDDEEESIDLARVLGVTHDFDQHVRSRLSARSDRYGRNPPHARWPGGARVALQFVLNYEEGAENSVLHGDPASETFLSEIIGAQPFIGARHMSMESLYEYGQPRRPVAAAALVRTTAIAADRICGGHGGGRAIRSCSGHGCARPRDCQPWLALDQLPRCGRRHRTQPCPPRGRDDPPCRGAAPLGWYTRAHQREYPAPCRGTRRLSL